MKSLYLAWQAPRETSRGRAWFPIGRLDAESETTNPSNYRFRYTYGAKRAADDVGFEPLVSFPDFQEDYRSGKLFPLFHNRVLSPKRADFPEYIDWLGLSKEEADPISILSVSGGVRVTDKLQTFPKVEADEAGNFQLRFFAHGLRYLNEASRAQVQALKFGDKLRVMVEVNNSATRLAATLHTEDYVMVGWAPRYLVEDLITCIPKAPEIDATVVKVNGGHAPLNQSLLIEYSGRAPDTCHLMSSGDFSPLVGK